MNNTNKRETVFETKAYTNNNVPIRGNLPLSSHLSERPFFLSKISFFKHCRSKKPSGVITLQKWVTQISELYSPIVDKVRKAVADGQPKAVIDKLKEKAPCATISGTFHRAGDKNLVTPTNCIALDIDYCNTVEAKQILSELDYVYYAGLSISGRGVVAVVPIADHKYHLRHFEALKNDLNKYGLKADESGKNIGRMRFYSYDMEPWINEYATPFRKLSEKPKPPKRHTTPTNSPENYRKIQLLINKIEANGNDITVNYLDWVKIGATLVNLFGPNGRDFYHKISQYYPGYTSAETDQQFDKCLKNPRPYGLGMIMSIAKKHGVILKH